MKGLGDCLEGVEVKGLVVFLHVVEQGFFVAD